MNIYIYIIFYRVFDEMYAEIGCKTYTKVKILKKFAFFLVHTLDSLFVMIQAVLVW